MRFHSSQSRARRGRRYCSTDLVRQIPQDEPSCEEPFGARRTLAVKHRRTKNRQLWRRRRLKNQRSHARRTVA
jgi:hypothetical protein